MTCQRGERVVQVIAHIECARHVLAVVRVDLLRVLLGAFHTQLRHEVGPGLIAVERQQRMVQIEQREVTTHPRIPCIQRFDTNPIAGSARFSHPRRSYI